MNWNSDSRRTLQLQEVYVNVLLHCGRGYRFKNQNTIEEFDDLTNTGFKPKTIKSLKEEIR